MEEVIRIVQCAYKDKTIKKEIGTVVKIVGDINIYNGSL